MNPSPENERSAPRQGDAPSSKQQQGQSTDSREYFNQDPREIEAPISLYPDALQAIPDGQTTVEEARVVLSTSHQGDAKAKAQAVTKPNAIRAIMAERAFDVTTVPTKPIPVLMLGDKVISTPGNLTNIQGLPKSGKSAGIGGILASMFKGNRGDVDTLGFSSCNVEEKAVIHFDTEQSRYDHDMLIRRAMARAQVETPPPWFYSYCLTDVSIPDRNNAFQAAIWDAAAAHGGIYAIIIDGVADFCASPNDEAESFKLVGDLHRIAVEHECAIITVLHENPGSEIGKMRGHLGSQLERKAETPLRLAKDAGTGITTIWSDRCRHNHIPKAEGTCFAWSDAAGMHVSMGRVSEIKSTAARVNMITEVAAAFDGIDSMRHTDLVALIERRLTLKERAATGRITKWLAAGLICKNPAGHYILSKHGKDE
jgi:hypothetical protein